MSDATTLIISARDRLLRIFAEQDEHAADIREIKLELKVAGLNPAEVVAWARAEHRDKVETKKASVADAVMYGEALGHDVGFMDLRTRTDQISQPRSVEKSSKVTAPVAQEPA